jgi:tetratricopeptide (TPR) repeat protein
MADAFRLDDIRSHALNNIGMAEYLLGDPRGIEDLAESLRIALARNSPESIRASLNLGNLHAHSGNLEEAFRVQEEGRRAAERFGDRAGIQWFAAERLWELYWRGEWDEAVERATKLLADVEAGAPRLNLEPGARLIRGWVEFARDRLDAALDDLMQLYRLARDADFLQVMLPALALRARVLAACGRDEDARADVDSLLRLWRERTAGGGNYWTADLAFAANELGCADVVEPALADGGDTRWLDASRAVVAGDHRRAAELFARIGSRPDEAVARLAAAASLLGSGENGGGAQLERALEFFREVRARRYLKQAEPLLSVTS